MEQMGKVVFLDNYSCASATTGIHIDGGLVGLRPLRFFGGSESYIKGLAAMLALLGGGGDVLRAKRTFLSSWGYRERLRNVLRSPGNLQYRNKCLDWWRADRSNFAISLPVACALCDDESVERDFAASIECVKLLGGNRADGLVAGISVMVVHWIVSIWEDVRATPNILLTRAGAVRFAAYGVAGCASAKHQRRRGVSSARFLLAHFVLVLGRGPVSAYGVPMPASRHTPPKSALPRSAMPVPAATGAAPRFEERVRAACRVRGYSIRTEDAYWMWTRQFILHHGKRHPETMGAEEIRAFLTALVMEREVAPGTQMQALNALVFVFRNVLERDPGDLAGIVRSKRARRRRRAGRVSRRP